MNEFVTWATLATYGGSLAMVIAITQLIKNIPSLIKVPTQIISYLLALIVLIFATAFTQGLTPDNVALIAFNAVIVSLGANGGYSALNKLFGTPDGTIYVDKLQEAKDVFTILVDDIDELQKKHNVQFKVQMGRHDEHINDTIE